MDTKWNAKIINKKKMRKIWCSINASNNYKYNKFSEGRCFEIEDRLS